MTARHVAEIGQILRPERSTGQAIGLLQRVKLFRLEHAGLPSEERYRGIARHGPREKKLIVIAVHAATA